MCQGKVIEPCSALDCGTSRVQCPAHPPWSPPVVKAGTNPKPNSPSADPLPTEGADSDDQSGKSLALPLRHRGSQWSTSPSAYEADNSAVDVPVGGSVSIIISQEAEYGVPAVAVQHQMGNESLEVVPSVDLPLTLERVPARKLERMGTPEENAPLNAKKFCMARLLKNLQGVQPVQLAIPTQSPLQRGPRFKRLRGDCEDANVKAGADKTVSVRDAFMSQTCEADKTTEPHSRPVLAMGGMTFQTQAPQWRPQIAEPAMGIAKFQPLPDALLPALAQTQSHAGQVLYHTELHSWMEEQQSQHSPTPYGPIQEYSQWMDAGLLCHDRQHQGLMPPTMCDRLPAQLHPAALDWPINAPTISLSPSLPAVEFDSEGNNGGYNFENSQQRLTARGAQHSEWQGLPSVRFYSQEDNELFENFTEMLLPPIVGMSEVQQQQERHVLRQIQQQRRQQQQQQYWQEISSQPLQQPCEIWNSCAEPLFAPQFDIFDRGDGEVVRESQHCNQIEQNNSLPGTLQRQMESLASKNGLGSHYISLQEVLLSESPSHYNEI